MKKRPPASSHKKVAVVLKDRSSLMGYMNPAQLASKESLDLLTPSGDHQVIEMKQVRGVYFLREFTMDFEPERKAFLSRPKLDGLWVKLTFPDEECIEGVVPNDLLSLLDHGVQITPPDLNGNTLRIFIPRTALAGMTVLGVVGIARRKPAAAATATTQPKLFGE